MRRSQIESMKPRVHRRSPYSTIEIPETAGSRMLFFRSPLARHRLFILLSALIVISVLVVFYQAFSVGRLSHILYTDEERRQRSGFVLNRRYEKADDLMAYQSTARPEIKIKGVLPDDIRLYIPNSRGNFHCVHTKEEIDYRLVNDNYCDCEDGSDEPSTNACNNGRFFCSYQASSESKHIPSSRVNDGLCDCCDGSDEWTKVELPKPARISIATQRKLKVFQAPCEFHC